MSEALYLPQPEGLQPGDVIQFADITELATFEDVVAPLVEPSYNKEIWSQRPHIRNFIRPPKFNGTIADIELEVMADPYERLLDAHERGWKLKGAGSYERTAEYSKGLINRYHGFSLTANAKSSGRGTVGQVQAELWYFPLRRRLEKAGTQTTRLYVDKTGNTREHIRSSQKDYLYKYDPLGEGLRRVVSVPKIETEKFMRMYETARKIGFETLRQAMMHPYRASHPNA